MSVFAATGRLGRYWASLPGNLRGILWLSLGAFLMVVVDVFVKTLGRKFDPFELALFRYGIGMIVLAPAFARMGRAKLRTQRIGHPLLKM